MDSESRSCTIGDEYMRAPMGYVQRQRDSRLGVSRASVGVQLEHGIVRKIYTCED